MWDTFRKTTEHELKSGTRIAGQELRIADLHVLKDFRHAAKHLGDRIFDYAKCEPNVEIARREIDGLSKELPAFARAMKIIADDPSGRGSKE
jgi:hypothetical protein